MVAEFAADSRLTIDTALHLTPLVAGTIRQAQYRRSHRTAPANAPKPVTSRPSAYWINVAKAIDTHAR